MWINAIGIDFKPRKSHLICSAHFATTDFMERPNASGVRLKNLAVPSIFFKTNNTSIINNPECVINPDPVINHPNPTNITMSTIEFTPIPTSAMPAWKNILNLNDTNTEASTSAIDETIKMTIQKPKKIMEFTFTFKATENDATGKANVENN